jgi:hypothetical protein
MSSAEKIASAIVFVALVTTLILPGRQSPQVIGAFGSAFNGALSTAMGTAKGQG